MRKQKPEMQMQGVSLHLMGESRLAVNRAEPVPRTTGRCIPRRGSDAEQPNRCGFPHHTEEFIFNSGCATVPNATSANRELEEREKRKAVTEQP